MNSVKDLITGVVHSGSRGGETACGSNTKNNIWGWYPSKEKVNCPHCLEAMAQEEASALASVQEAA